MKVMISQPMKGRTNEEIIEERSKVVDFLKEHNFEIVDNIFDYENSQIKDKAVFYLGKSIEKMAEVDAVVFMKGWETARGCTLEYDVARLYGKIVICL